MKLTRAMIIVTLILAMVVGLVGCTTVTPPAAPTPTPAPPVTPKTTPPSPEEEIPPPPPPVPPVPLPPPTTIDSSGRTAANCVEPTNSLIRQTALSIVAASPGNIDANSMSWKIWQVNYWIAENITYISDPKGHEYFAFAHETLETRAGDCDDFATLLASLYEAVGLDAILMKVDTDGDNKEDHMTCLVYWSGDAQSFIDEEKVILTKAGLTSPTGQAYIRFLGVEEAVSPELKKYQTGIWIIADPPMAEVKDMVGYITHKPYDVYSIVDVGA